MLFLVSDHAGFEMKEYVRHQLAKRGITNEDFGTFSSDPVDYPGYAKRLAKAVLKENGRGIMLCGSGQGMAIVANRFKGIRAAVIWDAAVAKEAREDNDANVVSLPARFISNELAWQIVSAFLSTTFSHQERHKRRLEQIDD